MTDQLLTRGQAARYLNVEPGKLARWAAYGPPPGTPNIPYHKVGREVRYRKADLDAWLDSVYVNPPEAA